MPNSITDPGLQVASYAEIIANLEAALRAIYGSSINLDSNSPDGQQVGLFGQSSADILELLVMAYNSFDPDNCSGIQLDRRLALCGVVRKAGTYTVQEVSITTDRAMTL